MRAIFTASLLFGLVGGSAFAAGEPSLGAPGDPPVVTRPTRNVCYDPERRIACLHDCAAERGRCAADPTACARAEARCAGSCPPKLCSRGGG